MKTRKPKPKLIVCVACGCDDLHACLVEDFLDETPCHWIAVNAQAGRGVCSAPACRARLKIFSAGDNSLSAKARARQDRINGRHVPRERKRA